MLRAVFSLLLLQAFPSGAAMGLYSADKLKALQDQGRTVLVHFNSAGCGVCTAQLNFLKLLAQEPSPAPEVLQANFGDVEALRRQYDVATPSTLLLFKGSQVIGKAVGLASAAEIRRFVDEQRMRSRFRPGPRPVKPLPAKR